MIIYEKFYLKRGFNGNSFVWIRSVCESLVRFVIILLV